MRKRPANIGAMNRQNEKIYAPSIIRVGVLVGLFYDPAAGGHVKTWERFARTAARLDLGLDLTVHFLGRKAETLELNERTRLQLHEPRWSSSRFSMLSEIPDHTDLAGYHPGLARALKHCDLIHTTDAFFSFAKTAERLARKHAIPLINSMHTDTPGYTRVYAARVIERLLGCGLLSRVLLNGLKIHLLAERRMRRRLDVHQKRSSFVLVAAENDAARLRALKGADRVGLLRRGIDKELFHPSRRDRAWLEQRWGIKTDQTVVLFVGRLSAGKNVMILAEAAARLSACGLPLQLVCAGNGPLAKDLVGLLGPAVTLPGVVLNEELARLYACADLFAMPSKIEVFSNVVQEAQSSGLPVLVSAGGGLERMIVPGVTGLKVEDGHPEAWDQMLRSLLNDSEKRQTMGRAARAFCESSLPSWDDVLRDDLLPFWRSAARLKTALENVK
jgi:glycosyltransferase involved in cell wall biosynthesis